jgi:hypothetical protein
MDMLAMYWNSLLLPSLFIPRQIGRMPDIEDIPLICTLAITIQLVINLVKPALQLNVRRNNKGKGFCEKSDFMVIGEENIAIGNGFLRDNFVMKKKLLLDQM